MSWASRPFAAAACVWAFLAWTPIANAEGVPDTQSQEEDARARARSLALQGIELFEHERWAEAHERLSQAYELFQAPTVALLDAKALEKLGRLLEAQRMFDNAANLPVDSESPKPFRRAVREAARERDRLERIIPSLTIEVRGADASHTLELNGKPVPKSAWGQRQSLDPGVYNVVVRRDGQAERTEQISVDTAASITLVLTLSSPSAPLPSADTPPPPQQANTGAWVALGVGALGITTGVVAGLVMHSAKNDLDDACTPECPQSSDATLSRFRTARTVSAAGYAAGAVGLGLSLWMFLDGAPASDAPVTGRVVYTKHAGTLQLSGAF